MIKKRQILIYICICFLCIGSCYVLIQKNTLKIAYVDSIELLKSYKPLIEVKKELAENEKQRQAKIDTLNSRLEIDFIEFNRVKDNLSKKELEYQSQLLNKKQRDLLQYRQAMQQEKEKDEKERTIAVIEPIEQIIDDYAKQKGYDMVISPSSSLLYINKIHDITSEILMLIENQ